MKEKKTVRSRHSKRFILYSVLIYCLINGNVPPLFMCPDRTVPDQIYSYFECMDYVEDKFTHQNT